MTENWTSLTSFDHLEKLRELSQFSPVIIFKHSTRCSISTLSWNRIKNEISKLNLEAANCFYLDLITYRSISNEIAEIFSIRHESPQILVILNDECVYNSSHLNINIESIKRELESMNKNGV